VVFLGDLDIIESAKQLPQVTAAAMGAGYLILTVCRDQLGKLLMTFTAVERIHRHAFPSLNLVIGDSAERMKNSTCS
jgi:hypothetical protein